MAACAGAWRASLSGLEHDARFAQRADGAHVVADEKNGAALAAHVFHLAEAFGLELGVADGQHLVHDEDFRVQVARPPRRPAARTCRCCNA